MPACILRPPPCCEAVLFDPNSWVVFPVCREAYLIGNALPLETETEDFQPSGLAWLQEWYFKEKVGFVYSPLRAPYAMEAGCETSRVGA